jgi:hypothetical protein
MTIWMQACSWWALEVRTSSVVHLENSVGFHAENETEIKQSTNRWIYCIEIALCTSPEDVCWRPVHVHSFYQMFLKKLQWELCQVSRYWNTPEEPFFQRFFLFRIPYRTWCQPQNCFYLILCHVKNCQAHRVLVQDPQLSCSCWFCRKQNYVAHSHPFGNARYIQYTDWGWRLR